MNKIYYFIVLTFWIITINSNSQIGKEFWFVAPDISDTNIDNPIVFRVTSFESPGNVTISIPSKKKVLKQFSISSNSSFSVEIDKQEIENTPSNTINDKGVYIKSDSDIAVYYEVSNPNNSEKFILKGTNALGKHFLVPSQNIYQNKNAETKERADIVATEDNTSITIHPTTDVSGHIANNPYLITLNKGQTYCIECNDVTSVGTLAGTEVIADKQIAITISDDAIVEDPDSHPNDLIGDQLIPVNATGTEYVAINTSKSPDSFKNTNSVQKVFVMAIYDNTLVFLNNTTKTTRALNKGEIAEFDISDHAIFIYATKKVYAYQITGLVNTTTSSSNELGSAILPSYNCNGSNFVSFTRVFNRDFWVNIIVKRKDTKSFTLLDDQGNQINLKRYINSWQTVPGQETGQSAWVCCAVNMDDLSTGTPYTLRNSSGLFHLCILDENGGGQESGCAGFGYFSSYNSFWTEGPTQACKGDYIEIEAKSGMKNYNWYSLNTDQNLLGTTSTLQVIESGVYYVNSEVMMGGCIFSDSITVNFTSPEINLGNDTITCIGEEMTYTLPQGYKSYQWSNGTNGFSTTLLTQEVENELLKVVVEDDFGCKTTDSVKIKKVEIPSISLNKTSVCKGELVINTTHCSKYKWEYGGKVITANEQQNYITPEESGYYKITAWNDEGCSVVEDIYLSVNDLPVINISDAVFCEGTNITINGPGGYDYLWSTGENAQSIIVNSSGNLWLEVKDENGCVTRDDFVVTEVQPMELDLGPDKKECQGVDIQMLAEASFINYAWTFKSSSSGAVNAINTQPENELTIINADIQNNGTYTVTAQDINGCMVSDEIEVELYNIAPPVLSITENLCIGQMVDVISTEGYDAYAWFKDGVEIVAAKNLNQVADIEDAGLYRVQASYGNCIKSTEISVVSHTPPRVILPNDIMLCKGEKQSLSVDNFIAYNGATFDYLYWNDDKNKKQSNYETSVYIVEESGTYSVTAFDNYGCSSGDQITIASVDPVTFDLGESIEICHLQSTQIENPITNAQAYQWFKINNGKLEHVVDDDPLLVSNTGTYILDVTDVNGCKYQDTIQVYQNPLPEISILGDSNACGSTTLQTYSDTKKLQYEWNGNFIMNTQSYNVDTSGIYKVKVQDENGCSSEDSLYVKINEQPVIELKDVVACEGDSAEIVAPSGYANYKWSTGQVSQNIKVKNTTLVWLQVEDEEGCKASDIAKVNFIKPTEIDLGPNRNNCTGISVALEGGENHSLWNWSFIKDSSNDTIYNISNSSIYQINNARVDHSGTYILKAQDVNGCLSEDEITLGFYEAEPPLLATTESLCDGKEVSIYASSGYSTYSWYINGIEQPELANLNFVNGVDEASIYKVEATIGACVKSNEIEVVKYSIPEVKVPNALRLCFGVETYLSVEEFNGNGSELDYLYWNADKDKRYAEIEQANLLIENEGEYVITAIDENGCAATDTTTVVKVNQPNLLLESASACQNQELEFKVEDIYTKYSWYNGESKNTTSFKASNAGDYYIYLNVENSEGCVFSDTMQIHIKEVPQINLSNTTICKGGTIKELSEFQTYQWEYNGQILNKADNQNWINPINSGIYRITALTSNGCTTSKNANVTIHSLPQFVLPNKAACEGMAVEINGPSGFENYLWSTGSKEKEVYLVKSGNYWLEVTDVNGCKALSEANLTYIKPIPFDLGNDLNECAGVEVTLTANPLYANYNWSFEPASNPGALISLRTLNDYTYKLENAKIKNNGIYYVQAQDVNGCKVSDNVTMTFYTPNPPNLSASQALCKGGDIDIEATKGYSTYVWYNSFGEQMELNNNSHVLENVNVSGTYRVEATIETCTLSKEIIVQEKQLPEVTLLSDFKLCNQEEKSIRIESYYSPDDTPLDYLYWNSNDLHRFSDWINAELTINEAQEYSITVIDANGCEGKNSVEIESAEQEEIALKDSIKICKNNTYQLVNPLTNYLKYTWLVEYEGGDSILAKNTNIEVSKSGLYKLQVTDLNGCVVEDDINIKVNAVPEASIKGDLQACGFSELTIEDYNNDYSYQLNGENLEGTDRIILESSGLYQLVVSDSVGCQNHYQLNAIIHSVPQLSLQNDTLCAGGEVVLAVPEVSGIEYLWSTGNQTSSITVKEGTYSLSIIDKNGCVNSDTANIVWRTIPGVNLGEDVLICPLSNWTLDAGAGYANYEWHNGSTRPVIAASLLDTVNTVIVTDEFGCTGFDSQTVKLKVAPVMEICSDTSICETQEYILDAGEGFNSYLWSDGDESQIKQVIESGEYSVRVSDDCYMYSDTAIIQHLQEPVISSLDTSIYAKVIVLAQGGVEPYMYCLDNQLTQSDKVFKNLKNGTHEFVVTDNNGCSATATMHINNVLDIVVKKFFTPNNDGYNDRWIIDGIIRYPDSIIKIYNRYGKLIAKYLASDPGWDGLYLGKPVPTDDYWYVIDLVSANKVLKGHITLKR